MYMVGRQGLTRRLAQGETVGEHRVYNRERELVVAVSSIITTAYRKLFVLIIQHLYTSLKLVLEGWFY